MKKIVTSALISALIFLSGCNDAKNETVLSDGNFAAKNESLSSQSERDIREDLSAINALINTFNTKAIEINRELVSAHRNSDSSAIKNSMEKSKKLLGSTNNALHGLKIKSQEVQDIRLGTYQGNMLTMKFYELSLKETPSSKEKEESELLKRQIIALQQSIGGKLDQLNLQY